MIKKKKDRDPLDDRMDVDMVIVDPVYRLNWVYMLQADKAVLTSSHIHHSEGWPLSELKFEPKF